LGAIPGNADGHADARARGHEHLNAHADADARARGHEHPNAHADPDRDSYPNADSDAQPD